MVSEATSTQWNLPNAVVKARLRTPIRVHNWLRDPEKDSVGKNSFIHDLHLQVLLLYAVLFSALYAVCFILPYGMTDAYTKLYESTQGTMRQDDIITTEGGRPILAVLTDRSFALLHRYQDLRYLSIAAILGIALVAWTIYQTLLMARLPRSVALLAPALICSTPAFQVFAAWAVCAYYPYAAALSGTALVSVEKSLAAGTARGRLGRLALGFVLLVVSLLIYQPSAMMYWVFAAIFLFAASPTFYETLRRIATYGVVAAVAFVLAYVAVKVGPRLIGDPGAAAARSSLVTDPMDKFHWFIGRALVQSLNIYNLRATVAIALIVLVSSLLGLFIFLSGNLWLRVVKLLIAVSLLPLSYIPNLVVSEDWAAYRTQVAMTALVVVYVVFALLSLRQAHLPILTAVGYAGMLALVVVAASSAATNVMVDIAIPQYEELALLHSQLSSSKLDTATSIYFIPSTWQESIAPDVKYDEFGVLSSSVAWSEQPMVYFVLQDVNSSRARIPVTIAPDGDLSKAPPGSLVVDMREISKLRLVPSVFG